jgi:hypothetical protein
MSALTNLDWNHVRDHYDNRVEIHRQLLQFYREGELNPFVDLLLGISDPTGNYSADEHRLGPQIIASNRNARDQVVVLARRFIDLTTATSVPELIRNASIRYLKIGVGPEASCMVNPDVCWVANTRTIWTHLVIKLKLYRSQDDTSEMAYRVWAGIHRELATSMTRIAEEGERLATDASVAPGPIKYLWADAIANALYASCYE